MIGQCLFLWCLFASLEGLFSAAAGFDKAERKPSIDKSVFAPLPRRHIATGEQIR